MKTLFLVAKVGSAHAADVARQIADRYPALTVVAETHLAKALGWPPPGADEDAAGQADLVVVLGGDGTLLHAARLVRGRAVPIMGVNLGSLGFMTEIPVQEVFTTLDDVLAGLFRTESRLKLLCKLWRDGQVVAEEEFLNDVVINKGALARIVDHEMSIDGQYVTTFRADGVIVATPTGSTAYSLSAGGPIVHPIVDGMIVTPICSHALTQRPLVLPSDRVVQIDIARVADDVYLTLDGKAGYPLKVGDRVEISRSANRVLLVRNPRMGYFAILRQKLGWGQR